MEVLVKQNIYYDIKVVSQDDKETIFIEQASNVEGPIPRIVLSKDSINDFVTAIRSLQISENMNG